MGNGFDIPKPFASRTPLLEVESSSFIAMHDSQGDEIIRPVADFLTTHWTVVLTAKGSTEAAQVALENLCQTYWYPLYAFIRRKGCTPHDAQDMTQGFFARLLDKDYLGQVDRRKGKFRSFLLAAMDHFVSDQRDRAKALKRGGGQKVISLDEKMAEEWYQSEPKDEVSPDKLFERRWAYTLLDAARARLKTEFIAAGKRELFDELRAMETGGPNSPSGSEAAVRLCMSEAAVKSASFRFRQRYREIIREEIARTVSTSSEIDEEIRYLISVVGG